MKKPGTHDTRTIALEALANLARDAGLISSTVKTLVGSSNRHGDLQVIRSAALHVIEWADILIAEEQGLTIADRTPDAIGQLIAKAATYKQRGKRKR